MSSKKSTKPKKLTKKEEIEETNLLQEQLPESDEHYVSPKQFSKLILEFYETNQLTDELVLMASKIAQRLAYKPNFINYTYREDMVGDAIIKMISALKHKKFNPVKAKGNPFSYFTKIAINAFKNRIKKEKKQHEAVMNYQAEMYSQIMNDSFHQNKAKVVTFSDYDHNEE